MKNRYFPVFAFIFFCASVQAQNPVQKEIPAETGKTYPGSLAANSVHSYTTAIDSAKFVYGYADQLTVDVVLNIIGPNGEKIASFDTPARGRENFQFETDITGKYRIEVVPFEKGKGTYTILISEIEKLAVKPREKVDQLMTHYAGEETPGAAVMVMKDDKIIFENAYGMANLTYDIPFKVSTPNNIGSTSKQFAAMAVSLLANRGKLSLDDDVRTYFPEFPYFEKKVSIRHLLTHTSGYRDYLSSLALAGHDISADLNREKILRVVQRQPELQNEPGAEWNYNNTGYALLAILVERISGETFPKWMQENIFAPLHMNHTMVRKNHHQIVPGASQGYKMGKDGKFQEISDIGGSMGAGGIYTTLEDLAKWIRNFENPIVGNEDIITEMTTPFVLTTGDTTNYGLGLFLGDYRGLRLISHGGADAAHRSMLLYFPEIDAAVVTQSNYAAFPRNMAFKIARTFFEEFMEKQTTKKKTKSLDHKDFDYNLEKFDLLSGSYELKAVPGFILKFQRDGERIYSQATGQSEIGMTALSDSLFKVKGVNAKITFHLNPDGSADSLTLHQNGNHKAYLINGWEPGTKALEEYVGSYFSEEIQTSYHIKLETDTLKLGSYLFPEALVLKSGKKDAFSGEFPIGTVNFKRDQAGKITGFEASNGRTKGVFFKKWKNTKIKNEEHFQRN